MRSRLMNKAYSIVNSHIQKFDEQACFQIFSGLTGLSMINLRSSCRLTCPTYKALIYKSLYRGA